MKHVICLAVASLIATSANAAEMKWTGSAGYRYEQTAVDRSPGTNTNKGHGFRANLGVSGGWENVEWGVGVRTQRNAIAGVSSVGGFAIGGAANDDHVFANSATDFGVGFEQAWMRYVREIGSVDLAATIGRQRNVFAYDSVSQTLFDNDVRFDGLGWQFKFGMFGLNAAQYVVRSQTNGTPAGTINPGPANTLTPSSSRLGYLFGIQPTMNWKFSDDIEAMFGVGYYYWRNVTDTNVVGGTLVGVAPATGGFNVNDPRQWQFTTAWTLPYGLSFNGEFVMNRSQAFNLNGAAVANTSEVSRSAWSAGLTYGSLKKAHDFSIGYAYGEKGLGAVANQYTHEKFLADNKGHTIRAAYALADNFHLGARVILLKDKSMLTAAGTASNNGTSSNYFEITSGVLF